jgi:HEAT repeat protein
VVVAEAVKPAVVADLKPLLAGLQDLDADVAREAATALGNSGNPAAVEPLIEIVQNTNGYFHSVVRSAAAAGLANLKDRRAVEALLTAVNDPITDPSTEAIRALAKLADPRAIAALVAVVRNETGFYAGSVRRAAVLGLTQLGGEVAKATLREVAANEAEDTVIRDEAIEAINKK